MERISLSNPAVIVNGNVIAIVVNSLKYDAGEGEITVRAASAGNQVHSIHTFNAETAISMVVFDLYPMPDRDSLVSGWKSNIGGNTISFTQSFQNGKTEERTFTHMSATAKIDRELSSDGKMTVEWAGDQMFLS